jgi:hypothetical protein
MNLDERIAVGLVGLAALELIHTVYLWTGISSRALKMELLSIVTVALFELAAWLASSAVHPPLISGWLRWVMHVFAAAMLVVVAVTRGLRSRAMTKGLEEDIELLERALALKQERTEVRGDEGSESRPTPESSDGRAPS